MSLTVGTRLGAYEILASIGSGGMGDVYRAHDPRLGRDVALKILPADVAADPERLARFQREARAVAALSHPHIVTIFSIEEAGGVPFLTMELVEGRSLDHTVGAGGISLARFFDIGVALADALSAAHRKNIVHRDVKPANVMVNDEGVVKMLDFGLARATESANAGEDDQQTSLGLTQAGIIVGTVPYMSPEQIEARPVDHRSDIFSPGVMLYEMATGTRPFSGGSSLALMSSILRDHPRPLTEIRSDVPEGIWRLVARCLEKSRGDRVQTAQEILVELKALRRTWESGIAAVAPEISPSAVRAVSSDLRVAVLPFTSRGGADAEALAEGLTDDVTAALSRFHYLRVVSRRDAESAKGQSADARAAATLGARYLLDGAVRAAGTTVRLSVRLIDTTTNAHIWAENYDRTLASGELFALQDDLTGRVAATVGDSSGVLARAMAAELKDRAVEELTVSELLLRYFSYSQHFRADEHLRLRSAFERALTREPNHAHGWGCLADLYEQEHSQRLNTLPDSLERSANAAARAVELDPTLQHGWKALSTLRFFHRDLNGLRVAAERTVSLNPFNTTSVGFVGLMRSYAGDWDDGVPIVQRAMDLNPHHAGWMHYVIWTDHYRKGEYEQALAHAKRSNMPQFVWTPLCTATVAGQLGLAADARAAIDAMRKTHPPFVDPQNVRTLWSFWQWDASLVERLVEGFVKALALVDQPTVPIGMRSGYLGGAMVAREAGQPASGSHASIAVLPFADLSAARDQEWFCDGIAEEILNALTPLRNLRVAARASAFSLRGKSDDLKTIGEKLNVTTVLGGSVRRAGDRVRITVQLSEVQNGFQIWSERYDRELKDIFDVQDEIAKAVAERLKVTLADTPLDRLSRLVEHGTTNIEAYQLYLQGRAELTRRGAGIPRALELFQKAVELDPDYSLAWAGIADAYTVLAYFGLVRGADLRTQALAAATRSIELDSSSAAGHTALACAVLLYDNDLARAKVEFERALELNPQYVQGRCWYALFYLQWACGLFEEGLAQARRALADDPLSSYVTMIVAACLYTAGHLDEAIATGRLAVERDPESYVARWQLGASLTLAGRFEEAITTLTAATALSGNPLALNTLAFAYGLSGATERAAAIYEGMKTQTQTYMPNAFLALTAAAAGHRDEGIALARRAWEEREPPFILFARHFPEYGPLRSDPRFAAILKEMETEAGPQRQA